MIAQPSPMSETDAQLVADIAAHDPLLAHRVQLRLRALRLRLALTAARPEPAQALPVGWLRWPWGPRG